VLKFSCNPGVGAVYGVNSHGCNAYPESPNKLYGLEYLLFNSLFKNSYKNEEAPSFDGVV
jgi:hypothetical protein